MLTVHVPNIFLKLLNWYGKMHSYLYWKWISNTKWILYTQKHRWKDLNTRSLFTTCKTWINDWLQAAATESFLNLKSLGRHFLLNHHTYWMKWGTVTWFSMQQNEHAYFSYSLFESLVCSWQLFSGSSFVHRTCIVSRFLFFFSFVLKHA